MVSKTALLDVNVLIALFDDKHSHHQITKKWFFHWLQSGYRWASCPITQNGCLRILSLPSYKNGFQLSEIKTLLTNAMTSKSHVFIPDNISLLQDELINWQHIQGAKQLTDAYLLALAKYNGAIFVSLDHKINVNTAMNIATQDFVCLITE